MTFTSGTQALQGRTVNHDPTPWRYRDGYRTARDASGIPNWTRIPRPQFAVHDNPILADFRNEVAAGSPVDALARLWLRDGYLLNDVEDHPGVNAHARQVLGKLAQPCTSGISPSSTSPHNQ